jgi:3-deoxy-manno-octulosonate cytidylyltransferase (CMP-KDO synthetase)
MIEHAYHRTALCNALEDVYVATCDEEIRNAVEAFGGKAVMTADTHERASDRVAEAAEQIDADVIVMVQGDEPMVVPSMIDDAIVPFEDASVQCVNLAKRIESEEEYRNANTIKVVMDRYGNALYFSREPIPTTHVNGYQGLPVFKQICIIPFRRDFLLEYARMEPTPLEIAESVDMLRILEHGGKVKLVLTDVCSYAVDTPADLEFVESKMRGDPLLNQYMSVVEEAQ